MKKIEEKRLQMHGFEFKILATKTPQGIRNDLYMVVGADSRHLKKIDSFKAGIDYLNNEFIKDWTKYSEFKIALLKEMEDKIYLFDIEPFSITETTRHFWIECLGFNFSVKVTAWIECNTTYVTDVGISEIEILNDTDMNIFIDMFIDDLFNSQKNLLKQLIA